jgi:hypothetical protein
MGILRGIGYFIAILILIGGFVLLSFIPVLGIGAIVGSVIMMWALHKGGQFSAMKKDIRKLRELQEENQRLQLDKMKNDALRDRSELDKE